MEMWLPCIMVKEYCLKFIRQSPLTFFDPEKKIWIQPFNLSKLQLLWIHSISKKQQQQKMPSFCSNERLEYLTVWPRGCYFLSLSGGWMALQIKAMASLMVSSSMCVSTISFLLITKHFTSCTTSRYIVTNASLFWHVAHL